MLYQSFSDAACVGTSVFSMTGGSLTAQVDPLFYANNIRVKSNLRGAQ